MYKFAGFFAKQQLKPPAASGVDAVWRAINTPFVGVGIRLQEFIDGDELPDPDRVTAIRERLGLGAAIDWLFIIYVCWGGRIDFVYGFGKQGERAFGPVKEFAGPKIEAVYLHLMGEFGVQPEDAMQFDPFVRGFWGDA